MKVVFFGTGKFGLPTLERLLGSTHRIAAVVTSPDRRKGRGWDAQPTPVKSFVRQRSPAVDILQPEKASDPAFVNLLKEIDVDVFVVVDYGQLLKKEVLNLPRKYCVNLHPSLLPRYRGAAPVNWAILNGEEETGNTVIRMNERMDAGAIIIQEKTKIGRHENAADLLERLSRSGAELMLKALEKIESGTERFSEQEERLASYAPKLKKNQGRIEWAEPAPEIVRKVRGLQPWPGAFTYLNGKILKVLEARTVETGGAIAVPGTIHDSKRFIVNAGEGAVQIARLQLEGRKAIGSEDFLRGHPLENGLILG